MHRMHHYSDTKIVAHEMTFHSLNLWYKSIFEKLGWMVLALEQENEMKIANYIQGIINFIASAKLKKKLVEENDRKDDIKIMIHNMKSLLKFVESKM
jgi:hypothetical protein